MSKKAVQYKKDCLVVTSWEGHSHIPEGPVRAKWTLIQLLDGANKKLNLFQKKVM